MPTNTIKMSNEYYNDQDWAGGEACKGLGPENWGYCSQYPDPSQVSSRQAWVNRAYDSGKGTRPEFKDEVEDEAPSFVRSPRTQDTIPRAARGYGTPARNVAKYGIANAPANAGFGTYAVEQSEHYQCQIANKHEYQAALINNRVALERSQLSSHTSPGMPTSDEESRTWVSQFVTAVKDTSDVLDKTSMNGAPAQSVARIAKGYYPDRVIEMAGWRILEDCLNAQLGIRLLDPHHSTASKREEFETFPQRMEAIINACRESKAVCKQILDPEYINRLVESPLGELQMKANNKKINGQRDKQNAIGRSALSRGLGVADVESLRAMEPITGDPFSDPTPKTPTRKGPGRKSKATATAPAVVKKPSVKRVAKRPARNQQPEDTENDKEYPAGEYTPDPRKKRASGHRQPAAPPAKPSAVTTRVLRRPRAQVQAARVERIQLGGSHMARHPSPVSEFAPVMPQLPLGPGNHAIYYRRRICEILNMDANSAGRYSLSQLRAYARAYNVAYHNVCWAVDGHEGRFWGENERIGTSEYSFDHFSQIISELRDIAVERGDLSQGGVFIANNPNGGFFDIGDNVFDKQALGMVNNPMGFHHNY